MSEQPVAIITGAGGGIGRATAVELARRGYRLALAGRNVAALEETAGVAGRSVTIVQPTDVTRSDEADLLVERTVRAFGRLDALVNNAGFAPAKSIEETSPADWRLVLETNLSSAFYLCRAAWPVFRRRGAGVVVNVSSVASRDPFPGFAAYGAAKAGLNLFGLCAAREGEAIGVRVHTIAPGATETAMFRGLMTDEQFPRDRTMDPADVADVIAQCVIGELRYTSGEIIYLHKTVS